MEVLRKYGAATTILFPLVDRGTLDFESTPVSFVAADTQISKDEGAFANTDSTPAHEGNGMYSLALTATEMEAARIMITCIDSATKTWEDQAIILSTYGNASGQHAFDLDLAEQLVALSATGKTDVNAEADTALTDYDAPTKAEMDTGHGLLATEAKQDTIDTVVDAVKAVTDLLPDAGALNDLATILADTGELQTDWANGGRLDLLLDAILADTGELQTDWANGGRLDLLIDAIKAVTDLLPDAGALNDLATILADTGELQGDDVPGLIAALNDPTAAVIADAVWDEAQADHVAAGSFGITASEIASILVDTMTTLQAELDGIQADTEDIQTRLPAALVSGRMDASVGAMAAAVLTAAAIATDAITAAKIAADAIGASELAADAAIEIADAILKRDIDNVEAAAPAHSLTVAILKAVSRVIDDSGTLKTYQTDGTTLKLSQALTTDAGNDPIDELGVGS